MTKISINPNPPKPQFREKTENPFRFTYLNDETNLFKSKCSINRSEETNAPSILEETEVNKFIFTYPEDEPMEKKEESFQKVKSAVINLFKTLFPLKNEQSLEHKIKKIL